MKKALDKAKSGMLIVNANDVDKLVSQNVGAMAKAPLSAEEHNGPAQSPSPFKAQTRLSDVFAKKREQRDHGFGLWVLTMMSLEQAANAPKFEC